jgi:hypothetical protein
MPILLRASFHDAGYSSKVATVARDRLVSRTTLTVPALRPGATVARIHTSDHVSFQHTFVSASRGRDPSGPLPDDPEKDVRGFA